MFFKKKKFKEEYNFFECKSKKMKDHGIKVFAKVSNVDYMYDTGTRISDVTRLTISEEPGFNDEYAIKKFYRVEVDDFFKEVESIRINDDSEIAKLMLMGL